MPLQISWERVIPGVKEIAQGTEALVVKCKKLAVETLDKKMAIPWSFVEVQVKHSELK